MNLNCSDCDQFDTARDRRIRPLNYQSSNTHQAESGIVEHPEDIAIEDDSNVETETRKRLLRMPEYITV